MIFKKYYLKSWNYYTLVFTYRRLRNKFRLKYSEEAITEENVRDKDLDEMDAYLNKVISKTNNLGHKTRETLFIGKLFVIVEDEFEDISYLIDPSRTLNVIEEENLSKNESVSEITSLPQNNIVSCLSANHFGMIELEDKVKTIIQRYRDHRQYVSLELKTLSDKLNAKLESLSMYMDAE